MPMQSVSELQHEPFDNFTFTDEGDDVFQVCLMMHAQTLASYYTDGNIPDPQAAVQDDGVLVLFWELDDWPLCIRLDPESWSRR